MGPVKRPVYAMDKMNRMQMLGASLLNRGFVSQACLTSAFEQIEKLQISLAEYFIQKNMVTSRDILTCYAEYFHLPIFDLENFETDHCLDYLNLEIIKKGRVIPIKKEQNKLFLGVTDPTDETTISHIRFLTGFKTELMLIDTELCNQTIAKLSATQNLNQQFAHIIKQIPLPTSLVSISDQSDETDEPIVQLLDHLIQESIERKVTDIHIEPYQNANRIRFRHDGILEEASTQLPNDVVTRLIARLKVLANLNIAEQRIPQDGHIVLRHKFKIDIRINTCPILHGEKVVLRLLDTHYQPLDLNALGFEADQKKIFLEKITQPHGLILVTGPTGSGKTITLYSALNTLNQVSKNIVTVEDPIEIELAGINQVNINPKIGFHFAEALRAFLRQDPDIIMVGEIRDYETACIAIQAAQTGHLVLSTLHTNSAHEALARLVSMGVEQQMLDSISLIIAQRLIRKLCRYCKSNVSTDKQITGCKHCYLGFQGRIGIFDLLAINIEVVKHMKQKMNDIKRNEALWRAGFRKINEGITNYAELIRVLGSPPGWISAIVNDLYSSKTLSISCDNLPH